MRVYSQKSVVVVALLLCFLLYSLFSSASANASSKRFFALTTAMTEKQENMNITTEIIMSSRSLDRPLRGSRGKWVQDWSYANQSNYPNLGSYSDWHLAAQNFTPTSEQPFRLATSWRWEDENFPVAIIKKPGFCQACFDLGITRILIVGDSLSVQFQRSLVSLLGHQPKNNNFNGHFKQVQIPCQNLVVVNQQQHGSTTTTTTSYTVTILSYRRSPISDFKALAVEAQERRRNNETTMKKNNNNNAQRDFVESNPNRTAIIANLGAWMKGMEEYQEGFDSLVSWIDSFHPTKILAFYRETIPGHTGCKPHGDGETSSATTDKLNYNWIHPVQEEPHANYESFSSALTETIRLNTTTRHNYDMFEAYNGYSHKKIQERSDDKVRIHWLNVYNSSVLRRDGHVGFGDCLHYYSPGPTDWWVHFFYSAIRDLANGEANGRNTSEL